VDEREAEGPGTFVLKLAFEKKLVKGKVVGVDATNLEANAAMKSIVRRNGDGTIKWSRLSLVRTRVVPFARPLTLALRRVWRARHGPGRLLALGCRLRSANSRFRDHRFPQLNPSSTGC
jgi:hypothetical protein